jgi:hypothetical protein
LNKRFFRCSSIFLLLVSVAVGLPVRAVAFQACVNKVSGTTRILLKGGSCKRTETAISLYSAAQVVDSNGTLVGQEEGNFPDLALRQINGVWFALPISSGGFLNTSDYFVEYFATNDCTGNPYVGVDTYYDIFGSPVVGLPIVEAIDNGKGQDAQIWQGVLYYATQPLQLGSFQSYLRFDSGPTQPPEACIAASVQTNAGLMATFDLYTLGLVPPLHLQ